MQIIVLFAVTAAIFLALDVVGLRFLIKPVFDRHVAHLFATSMRMVPAVIFYLGYVGGILWFVSVPAMRSNEPTAALVSGALLGLLAYGTYEFTNYTTLQDWSVEQVALDTIWGGVLTGFSAWAGVMIVRTFV